MDCVLMETSAYKEMQAHLQRLLERVSALHSLSAQPTTVRRLTAEEVCKALSITKRALQYYRSAGIIPYTALGNKVLFRDDDIRQLLEKNLIKSLYIPRRPSYRQRSRQGPAYRALRYSAAVRNHIHNRYKYRGYSVPAAERAGTKEYRS